MSDKITEKKSASAAKLPEHGPIDENGREVLLSLRNVDITFGKGDKAVYAVKDASFDIYKGSSRRYATSPTPSTRKAPPLRSRSVTAAT